MPFEPGKSPETFKHNLAEAFKSYRQKGTFGTSGPISPDQARKRILAAAYEEQRRSTPSE